jgi:hypothetical protein
MKVSNRSRKRASLDIALSDDSYSNIVMVELEIHPTRKIKYRSPFLSKDGIEQWHM